VIVFIYGGGSRTAGRIAGRQQYGGLPRHADCGWLLHAQGTRGRADVWVRLIAFAETGNPNTTKVKWPAWSEKKEQKLDFADTIHVEDLDSRRLDWLAAHPAKAATAPAPVRPHD
jgi:hypothetical protein